MDYIKDYIKNKGTDGGECTKVLGTKAKRDQLAAFYEKNADLVHLISVDSLINYVATEAYTPSELGSFQAGVASLGTFLHRCLLEREQEKNKKSLEGDN